jgi:hypothetical protein
LKNNTVHGINKPWNEKPLKKEVSFHAAANKKKPEKDRTLTRHFNSHW